MLAIAEVRRAVSLVVRWAMAPAKTKTRMGMACMPETSPTQRLESVRAYMTHDWAAVRATAPMSKRAWKASRRVKPGMARTRTTWGGAARRVRVLRRVLIGGHRASDVTCTCQTKSSAYGERVRSAPPHLEFEAIATPRIRGLQVRDARTSPLPCRSGFPPARE